MRTPSPPAALLRGHQTRLMVVAVAEPDGVDDAAALLTGLPTLPCPIVVGAAPTVRTNLLDRLGGVEWRDCEAGASIHDAPLWLMPEGHIATIDRDHWTLSAHANADHGTQVGRLCSSARSAYRSRVFLVCTDGALEGNPFVRLLVQRGAPLVETRDRPDRGLADHAPVPVIIDHLRTHLGPIEKASA